MKFSYSALLITLAVGSINSPIVNGNTHFDLNRAYRMAEAAKCSYYTEGFLKSEMSVTQCMQNVKDSPELSGVMDQDIYTWTEGKDGYILINTPDEVILAMRGTLPPLPYEGADFLTVTDWLNNFSALPDNEGFHRRFMGSWHHIMTNLEQEKAKAFLKDAFKGGAPKKFIVTGHSKGGAMAIIAAIKMSQNQRWTLPEPDGFYSFAGARP